jgi:hypothetical protein
MQYLFLWFWTKNFPRCDFRSKFSRDPTHEIITSVMSGQRAVSANVLAYLSVASWRAEYFLQEYFLKVAKMFRLAKCSDCKYALLADVRMTMNLDTNRHFWPGLNIIQLKVKSFEIYISQKKLRISNGHAMTTHFR